MKYEMVKDEKAQAAEAYEKRMNQLIRDFVQEYNNLGTIFTSYQTYVDVEGKVYQSIIKRKDKTIDKLYEDINEYQSCLRIPRQHYKHIEKLRLDELAKQRDEIIKKLKKRYGIDPTQSMQVLKMPDPNLPIEQQMELAQGTGIVPGGPKPTATDKAGEKIGKISA